MGEVSALIHEGISQSSQSRQSVSQSSQSVTRPHTHARTRSTTLTLQGSTVVSSSSPCAHAASALAIRYSAKKHASVFCSANVCAGGGGRGWG